MPRRRCPLPDDVPFFACPVKVTYQADPYRSYASRYHGIPLHQVTPEQRTAGKKAMLAAAYSADARTVYDIMGVPMNLFWHDDDHAAWYLRKQGYTLRKGIIDRPGTEPTTQNEVGAILFLVEEWDYEWKVTALPD